MQDESFWGSVPPVQVNAQQCGTVQIEVKFISETRDHDTLRKFADTIDRMLDNGGSAPGTLT